MVETVPPHPLRVSGQWTVNIDLLQVFSTHSNSRSRTPGHRVRQPGLRYLHTHCNDNVKERETEGLTYLGETHSPVSPVEVVQAELGKLTILKRAS